MPTPHSMLIKVFVREFVFSKSLVVQICQRCDSISKLLDRVEILQKYWSVRCSLMEERGDEPAAGS
jgi:hypothetical protein